MSTRLYPSRVITPKGEETAYGYDTVGRRLSISNTYGTVELAYNSRNFVTSRIDGEGYTTRRFYDRMGNLTTYYPPVQWEKKESGYEYRHDFLERVVDTISPLQEHHRVFRNFDGDITSRIHPVSYALKGEEGEGTRYEYNSDGNCIRILYPDGAALHIGKYLFGKGRSNRYSRNLMMQIRMTATATAMPMTPAAG